MGTPKLLRGADDGLGSLSVREIVESALEQEDIIPVVYIHFQDSADNVIPCMSLCVSARHSILKAPGWNHTALRCAFSSALLRDMQAC